jgi:hypothetical protein
MIGFGVRSQDGFAGRGVTFQQIRKNGKEATRDRREPAAEAYPFRPFFLSTEP